MNPISLIVFLFACVSAFCHRSSAKRGAPSGPLFAFVTEKESMQVEIHVDNNLHSHPLAVVHRPAAPVLPYRLRCLVVQSHPSAANDADVLRIPLLVNNKLNGNVALEVCGASFRGKFRIVSRNQRRSADAASHAHQAAAEAAAAARPGANATARSDAAAHPGTESGTAAPALRCQRHLGAGR